MLYDLITAPRPQDRRHRHGSFLANRFEGAVVPDSDRLLLRRAPVRTVSVTRPRPRGTIGTLGGPGGTFFGVRGFLSLPAAEQAKIRQQAGVAPTLKSGLAALRDRLRRNRQLLVNGLAVLPEKRTPIFRRALPRTLPFRPKLKFPILVAAAPPAGAPTATATSPAPERSRVGCPTCAVTAERAQPGRAPAGAVAAAVSDQAATARIQRAGIFGRPGPLFLVVLLIGGLLSLIAGRKPGNPGHTNPGPANPGTNPTGNKGGGIRCLMCGFIRSRDRSKQCKMCAKGRTFPGFRRG